MQNEAFEWDDHKAAHNYADHGVSFEAATKAFNDPFGIERWDDREAYGEDRFILIALAEATVLTVVYTERNGRSHLISARCATTREQDDYFTQST